MIVINYRCSSTIEYDLGDQKITFGDYTIRLCGRHVAMFDWVKDDEQIKDPTILLEKIIQQGLEMMFDRVMLEDLHDSENKNTEPTKPSEYMPEDEDVIYTSDSMFVKDMILLNLYFERIMSYVRADMDLTKKEIIEMMRKIQDRANWIESHVRDKGSAVYFGVEE